MGGGITRLRNNAFTLIELLAIIVILAIIAVITVPIILNIIENSRKGAATDSAYGYKDSVNKTYIAELSKPNQGGLKLNGTYEVQDDGTLEPADGYSFGVTNYNTLPVSVSGTMPSSGSLHYTNNVLDGGYLVIGDYRVTFNQGGTVTTEKNNGSSSTEQSSGGSGADSGSETPSNPYLTRFDGVYTYHHKENLSGLDTSLHSYLRTDGTTNETCGVFGSGQAGTVCLTSSYYNIDYSTAGNYGSDFVDCSVESTYDGTGTTCLKGYTKAKVDEMLSKGASSCFIFTEFVQCDNDNVFCSINTSGDVLCNGDNDTECAIGISAGSLSYCQ